MTTFKEIRGTDILALSSDPANPELGQIWYNSSSGTLKGYRTVNAWSSGGTMNTARRALGSAGTQTATLAFGGAPNPAVGNKTESYNGTSWTNVANLNIDINATAGAGTQTNAVSMGGYNAASTYVGTTQVWNGTAWTTNPTGLSTARSNAATATGGPADSNIVAGGYLSGDTVTTATEEWTGIEAQTKTVTVS